MEADLKLMRKSLSDIQSFLEGVAIADTFYSSSVTLIPLGESREVYGHIELKRRHTRELEYDGWQTSLSVHYSFAENGALLPVIRTLAACPTWTHARFEFLNKSDFGPVLDGVMLELFYLLRFCRSLSTLDLPFLGFSHIPLPTLLCGNPFLETLVLRAGRNDVFQNHMQSIAEYLSRNSVLKSCKLVGDYRTGLKPYTITSQSETNDVLKELEIRIQLDLGVESGPDEEAIANLVRYNTTLEKLELLLLYNWKSHVGCKLIAGVLEINHTLKEFRFQCSVAEMKELVRVLVPDRSGHQPNTSLSSLTLFAIEYRLGEDFMDELALMLKLNTTLKHVQVSGGYARIKHEIRKTRDKLELMMRNELRLNSSLQSLVVGHFKLLRVGMHWQMSYGGPCLHSMHVVNEYLVKVKMH